MTELLRPLNLGGVRLPNNLVLSPMAGFSDLPFRVLCRRHGAGLVSSEMVAASSVEHDAQPHLRRMRTTEEERPTSVQLFGLDPVEVGHAAHEAERHCDVLGFNMGCPAAQIKRQGCGAALLDHPERAEELVRSIKESSRLPLLVKLRAGNGGPIDVVSFARRLEEAGADGLLFHARTARQGYSGRADWALVRAVKDAVAIPVVANGDVVDGPSAQAALETSGADGLAIGRAALGDPRIFHRVGHYLQTGEALPPPTSEERVQDFLAYLELAERVGIDTPQILQQAQRFTRGVRGGGDIRTSLRGGHTPVPTIREQFVRGVLAADIGQ